VSGSGISCHVQVYTSLQTDNHTSPTPLFFTGRALFLAPNQPYQSTEGKAISDQFQLQMTTDINKPRLKLVAIETQLYTGDN